MYPARTLVTARRLERRRTSEWGVTCRRSTSTRRSSWPTLTPHHRPRPAADRPTPRQGWAQAHIAAAMGISRKCVRTWITRFETEGLDGCRTDPAALTTVRHEPPTRSRNASSSSAHRERRGPTSWCSARRPGANGLARPARHGVPHLSRPGPHGPVRCCAPRRSLPSAMTGLSRCAGALGRQEDRSHPRRRRLARPWARRSGEDPRPQHQGRLRLRALLVDDPLPLRTPRSLLMRRARPVPVSCLALRPTSPVGVSPLEWCNSVPA